MNGQKIDTRSSVRNVVVLSVHAKEIGTILDPFEVLHDSIPRGTADVLKDNERWPMFINPRHHTSKCSARFSVRVDILLLVVKRRVIYAGSTCNQEVDISRDGDF